MADVVGFRAGKRRWLKAGRCRKVSMEGRRAGCIVDVNLLRWPVNGSALDNIHRLGLTLGGGGEGCYRFGLAFL